MLQGFPLDNYREFIKNLAISTCGLDRGSNSVDNMGRECLLHFGALFVSFSLSLILFHYFNVVIEFKFSRKMKER
jgi:hypothetical protein